MGRRHGCGRTASARAQSRPASQPRLLIQRVGHFDRKSLLLSTALASTLVLVSLGTPTPAHAVTNCLTGNPPPGPITVAAAADDIVCVNVDNRSFAGLVINLSASGGNHYINLYNSGILTANARALSAVSKRSQPGAVAPSAL
jgi:hypothetical protein